MNSSSFLSGRGQPGHTSGTQGPCLRPEPSLRSKREIVEAQPWHQERSLNITAPPRGTPAPDRFQSPFIFEKLAHCTERHTRHSWPYAYSCLTKACTVTATQGTQRGVSAFCPPRGPHSCIPDQPQLTQNHGGFSEPWGVLAEQPASKEHVLRVGCHVSSVINAYAPS